MLTDVLLVLVPEPKMKHLQQYDDDPTSQEVMIKEKF